MPKDLSLFELNLTNMELRYAWIKDFKNIKTQGFSFNDAFFVEYEPITGILEIFENLNCIPNFFGKVISSVTGIVGSNGAGKSNLLEFIKMRLSSFEDGGYSTFETGFEAIFILDDVIFCHINLKLNNTETLKEAGFQVKYFNQSVPWNAPERDNVDERSRDEVGKIYENRYIYYSNIFDLREENLWSIIDISTNYLVHADRYLASRYRNHDHSGNKSQIQALHAYSNEETRRQLDFVANNVIDLPFSLPDEVSIRLEEKYHLHLKIEYDWYEENELKALRDIEYIFRKDPNKEYESQEDKKSIYRTNFLWKLITILAVDNPEKISPLTSNQLIEFIINGTPDVLKDQYEDPNEYEKIVELLILFAIIIEKSIVGKRSSYRPLDRLSIWETYDILFYKLGEDSKDVLFRFFNLYNDIVSHKSFLAFNWDGLSSGQQNMLIMFSRFYSARNDSKLLEAKHLVIMIDEGETYFHPSWQAEFVSDILQYLEKLYYQKTIQVILTSNSPFIASDLPKTMINFMYRSENGMGVVVDGLSQSKQTFGANIHTLYTDAFFMNNTLMGSFAKKKIDGVIRIINKEQAFNDEFPDLSTVQKIINCIGEPVLRSLLQRQLDSLRLEQVDDIQAIKEEMSQLAIRLRKIEDNDPNKEQ